MQGSDFRALELSSQEKAMSAKIVPISNMGVQLFRQMEQEWQLIKALSFALRRHIASPHRASMLPSPARGQYYSRNLVF
jgi:hypothetical protein